MIERVEEDVNLFPACKSARPWLVLYYRLGFEIAPESFLQDPATSDAVLQRRVCPLPTPWLGKPNRSGWFEHPWYWGYSLHTWVDVASWWKEETFEEILGRCRDAMCGPEVGSNQE